MKEKRKTFKYHRRSEDTFQKQAESSGGSYDKLFKDTYKEFRPKEGEHRIRLMPPTFKGAEHYAMPIYVHSNVGPDNQVYLCLNKMQHKPCPVCEEHRRAQRGGDEEYADKLRPYERRVAWVIDRKNEKDGPLLYNMPFGKQDKRICAVAKDPDSGQTLFLDDPDEGFDVFFQRIGKGLKTDYTGQRPSQRPSPLSRDDDVQREWLTFITENPLDECLRFYSYDHIAEVFGAQVSREDKEAETEDEEEEEPRTRDAEHERARSDFRKRVDQRGSKRVVDEDEEEDEEEEVDEQPVRSKGKARREEPDEDEDESDEVDEDEEEETERRPSRKSAARRRPDADEESDDDADEEERPARGTADRKKPARPSKAEQEDDEEVEEDVDEEPTRRSRPAGSTRGRVQEALSKTKAGRRAADDDDDDEDEEEEAPRGRKLAGARR